MTRASSVIFLGLILVLAAGQLTISSPSYVNLYTGSQGDHQTSYYDTGFYQVYMTDTGYSVASEATGIINLFENPNCVGTNISQFFCINSGNSSKFNQINLTTGVEYEIFSFNDSIYSLQSYQNAVQVFFTSDLATLQVIIPPSTVSVCNLSVSAGNTFEYVQYFDGQVMTSPASSCTDDCYYNLYNCSNTTNVNQLNITLPDDLFSQSSWYYTNIMWLSNGVTTQIVGFPYGSYPSSAPLEYHGYIIFSTNSSVNSTFINSTLTNYTQVIQINLTNILVLNTVGELQQYAFNFETLTFAPAGPVLSVPNGNKISVSPITNNSNQVAIVYSDAQQGSNFYINLNTMTISNWVYFFPAQTFTNGSTFSFTSSGYFVANGSTITNVYDTTYSAEPSNFIAYGYPSVSLNYALALVYNSNSPAQLFIQYLTGNLSTQSITIPGSPSITSYTQFVAFTANGTEYTAIGYDTYYMYVYAYSSTNGQVLQQSLDYGTSYITPMFFVSNTTNLVYVYTDEYYTTYSTVNGSQAQQNTYPQQFGNFQKLSETLFVAWTVNYTDGSVNSTLWFYVIDAFTQAVQGTYVIQNTTVTSASDLIVYATLNSAGTLQALYISEPLEATISSNWIVYADNSSYFGNFSTVVLPGASNSALFCNVNFGGEMINCTNFQVTDSAANNEGSGGSAGTIIVIIIVVVVLLAAGFFVRRNMIQKRAGSSTSGITLAKV